MILEKEYFCLMIFCQIFYDIFIKILISQIPVLDVYSLWHIGTTGISTCIIFYFVNKSSQA